MEREQRQLRAQITNFETREDGGAPHIAGHFAVFDSVYEIGPGMSESFAPGAFSGTLSGDIRALTNHDSTLVLGRTLAGTLELREDNAGLWADVTINPNDTDAMNTWQRVKRGDVSQCSIGFDIIREDTEIREDGSTHWTIREVKLWEVSVCTFPAYEQTNISARAADRDAYKARQLAARRERVKGVLKHGLESFAAAKKD